MDSKARWGAACLVMGLVVPKTWALQSYDGDPGRAGDPASWRTAEFNRDWGLQSMGAEFAYAAGYSGAGISIGEIDSGYWSTHPEFSVARYFGVEVNGIAGAYNSNYNDRHGTHVGGTIGANRDGDAATTNMHGVAFNSSVYVGNTGKTDAVLFGSPQTTQTAAQTINHQHIADAYRAVNAKGVRIISTSWGSQPNTEQYDTLKPSAAYPGRIGLLGSWGYLVNNDTWIKGALDAAATGTLMVFSAGNSGYANPSARAAAAYFDPQLESNWLAVSAISETGKTSDSDGSVLVPGEQRFNQCGVAKWSCVTAPGRFINGTVLNDGYARLSGTSMAAPHASGALAVIMERFPYLSNAQVLIVMKTTAIQNSTVNDSSGVAMVNPTAGQLVQVPDDRNGWGTPSLRHAMNGPAQLLDHFAVDTQGYSDTWSNAISDTAIQARKAEDDAEALTWKSTKEEKGWVTGLPEGASADDMNEYTIGMARETARNSRVYAGSLEKLGAGTLTLSGANSYTGATTVSGGVVQAGAVNSFSPVSAHRVGINGVLDLAGFNQTLASMNIAGIVSLPGYASDYAPGTTLTVTGPWVGQGGALRLSTVLNDSSALSDRLILDGPEAKASGNTVVQIVNMGGLGARTTGNGIEVVSAVNGATTTAQSSKDAFSLRNGHIDAGAFEYRLQAADANNAGENWYLRSTFRKEVPLLGGLPQQLRQSNLAMLANLRQRQGNENSPSVTAGGRTGDAEKRAAMGEESHSSQAERRAWGRWLSSDLKMRQSGETHPASEGRQSGFQVGSDLWANPAWRVGLYAGKLIGDMQVRGFTQGMSEEAVGQTELSSLYAGLYATRSSVSGFYLNAILQNGRHKHQLQPLQNASVDGRGRSLLSSVEIGQTIPLSESWRLEPQAQLIYQRLKLNGAGLSYAEVRLDNDSSWTARLGLRVFGRLELGSGSLQPYGRVSLYRASNGTDSAHYVGPAATTEVHTRIGGIYTELAVGATWALGTRTSLYGEFGKLKDVSGLSRVKSGINASLGLKTRW